MRPPEEGPPKGASDAELLDFLGGCLSESLTTGAGETESLEFTEAAGPA